jgi:peptidoglycan hydrolase-like protein with peptidoglycan-binding domain
VPIHGTIARDLASPELWQRSLERSRRRRVLAEDARKEIARRKTTTFALTAAVAAAPISPGAIAALGLSKGNVDKRARSLDRRHVERILLTYGDRGSSVAALQQALQIPADGIFGPQTQAAVRDYQRQHGLDPTGEVNVHTWLTLFPTDMIVYAPPGTASALGANHTSNAEWAAVSTQEPGSSLAVDGQAIQAAASHKAVARAADVFNGGQAATQGDGPNGTPPVDTGPPAGVGPGVGAPVGGGPGGGGGPGPAPPSFNFPHNGTVGEMIAAMMRAARSIDRHHYAYSWGGGHNSSFSGPYDCSGAVSAVLHAAGLLSSPRVSGGFMHWGAPGPGAVTIYANAGHVYMSILGHYFGTSSSNPGGGAGWFRGGPRPGFAVVHVPFSKLHLRRHHRRHHRRPATTQPTSGSQPQVAPDTTGPKPATTTDSTGKTTTTQPQPSSTIQPSGTQQTAVSQPVQQAQTTQPAPAPVPQTTSPPVASGQTQAQPVTPSAPSGPAQQAPVSPPAAAPAVPTAPSAPTPAAPGVGPGHQRPAPKTPSRGYAPGTQGQQQSADAPGKLVSARAKAKQPGPPQRGPAGNNGNQ